ncbi:ISLre2 family transposase [Faecalimonas umbilicata]|nr:ISLre2 family transposase [Faecalimonas umbilicata]
MIKSIQQFEEAGTKKLEKIVENFIKDPKDMASFVYGVRDEVVALGLDIIKETLEDCNQMLRDSAKRKQCWEVVRTDQKKLTTSLGTVCFEKTLFRNKQTRESAYLLDRILGIESHERLTEDAEAKLLEEAVQASYRKAGEETSLTDHVSKQTVKNKLHKLTFPQQKEEKAEKKVVDYLYIDADEDHVSLQFNEKKGDLEIGENHWKNNCVLAKLVYVYEGIEPEAPKSKRHRLVNPHYFSGIYAGEDNAKLWDEVYAYMDSHYDLEKVKKIYLNADGGGWIQSGKKRIVGTISVLDEFHLKKYLLKMTGHMKDSAADARKELCDTIKNGTREDFQRVVERLKDCAETEAAEKRIDESASYILSNWMAAKIRLEDRKTVKGCSAEGHVSHVLSSRMSSRPMGWSRTGVDKMAHLRAYYWNGGDMLELVRGQEMELPIAVGAEKEVLSCESMLRWERRNYNKLGKYAEGISHSVSTEVKKYAWFNAHIWGL